MREGLGTSCQTGTWNGRPTTTLTQSIDSQNGYAYDAKPRSNLTMPFFGISRPLPPDPPGPNMGDGLGNVAGGDGYAPKAIKWVPSTIVPPNSFHLLPPASQPSTPQPKANPSNKRKSEEVAKPPASDGPGHSTRKGKGKGKSKSKKNGRGPNVPRDLVGKVLEKSGGTRIC